MREVDVFCAIGGSVSPLRFSFDKWNFTLESRQTREWKQTQNEPSVKLLFLFRLTYGITNRLSLQSKEKKKLSDILSFHIFFSNFFHRISIFHNFPLRLLALVPLVTTECLREHIKSMVKLFIISKQQQNNTQQPKRRTVSNDDKHIENMKNRIVIVIRISWPTLESSSGKHEKKTDKTKHSNFRTLSLQLSVALNQPCLYSKWFVFFPSIRFIWSLSPAKCPTECSFSAVAKRETKPPDNCVFITNTHTTHFRLFILFSFNWILQNKKTPQNPIPF